jgi:hypothetical protein
VRALASASAVQADASEDKLGFWEMAVRVANERRES